MKIKRLLYLTLLISLLAGCASRVEKVEYYVSNIAVNGVTTTPLFTPTGLIMYNKKQLDECTEEFQKIVVDCHKACDRDNLYSDRTNIKTINDSYGSGLAITVDEDLFSILEQGINLTKLTKGKFNLAMGSLIDAWDGKFSVSNSYGTDIDSETIRKALTCIPNYEVIDDIIQLDKTNKTVKLNALAGAEDKVIISLGGIAKGYAIEKARNYIQEKGYSAIVSAGTSSMATSLSNPLKDRDVWNIAVKLPELSFFGGQAFTATFEGSTNFSTSGDYEQNFLLKNENDDGYIIRHHILNPDTGYSANYHRAITLFSYDASSTVLDALTTALMNFENIEAIKDVIDTVNKNYSSTIEYCVFDAYNNSYDEFSLQLSKGFNSVCVSQSFSNKIKSKNVI